MLFARERQGPLRLTGLPAPVFRSRKIRVVSQFEI